MAFILNNTMFSLKKREFSRTFFVIIGLLLCPDPQKTVRAEDIWCESVAVISDVEKIDELPTYEYSLSYRAPESTALDKYGNKITKISQFSTNARKPIEGQKIKLRYLQDEPIIFEFVDDLQYEDDDS